VTELALKALKENKTTVPRKEWITSEIVNMIEERRTFKNGTTLEHKRNYRKLRNLVSCNKKAKRSKGKILRKKIQRFRCTDENW